jgi:hypothetical protein
VPRSQHATAALAATATVVLAAVVLAVTAVNAQRPANRIALASSGAVSSSLAETDDAAETKSPPEQLTGDTPLDLYGIGPIEVGMTLAEAERVAGVNLIPGNFEDFDRRCFFARAEGLEETFVLILNAPGSERLGRPEDGIIRTVSAGEGTETLSGIGIGDTEKDVYKTYRDRIESEPPVFNGSPLHFLKYTPRHPADQDYNIRFLTNGKVVQDIFVGYKNSTYVPEGGCN